MLAQQAILVLSRLQTAEKAKSGVEQAHEFHELRKELAERLERLRILNARARLFRQNKIPLKPVPEVEIVVKTASDIATRFGEAPTASTLKRGRWWSGLLANLDLLETNSRLRQTEDWKTFHSTQLFAGAPPEQVKVRVALTPKNMDALVRYTELYAKFAAHRNVVPETAETIQEIRKNSDALGKIKFEEDVPSDVKQFLDATASSVGASLELLKPSVIEWLRSNKLLSTYVVRSRIT